MSHKSPLVPVPMPPPPRYRKRAGGDPPQYVGKRSPPPPMHSWGKGSYSPTTGRAVRVGRDAPPGAAQIPTIGPHTTEGHREESEW